MHMDAHGTLELLIGCEGRDANAMRLHAEIKALDQAAQIGPYAALKADVWSL